MKRQLKNIMYLPPVLTVFIVILASAACADENLLVNPGFEAVEPMSWAPYGNAICYIGTSKSGEQSGKTWVWDFGDGLFEQFVEVTPGVKYRASVYILSKSDDPIGNGIEAWMQVEWCTAYNVPISDPIKSPALTKANNKWELFSTPEIIAPPNAAKAKIKLIIKAPKKNMEGSCYFDDAVFTEVSSFVRMHNPSVFLYKKES